MIYVLLKPAWRSILGQSKKEKKSEHPKEANECSILQRGGVKKFDGVSLRIKDRLRSRELNGCSSVVNGLYC